MKITGFIPMMFVCGLCVISGILLERYAHGTAGQDQKFHVVYSADYSCPACSVCPACERCPDPWEQQITDEQFIEVMLGAAEAVGATSKQIDDLDWLWHRESRNTVLAVSKKGAVGACQAHIPTHKKINPVRIMTDPQYAGEECFQLYMDAQVCGSHWYCCYLNGVKGCKDKS